MQERKEKREMKKGSPQKTENKATRERESSSRSLKNGTKITLYWPTVFFRLHRIAQEQRSQVLRSLSPFPILMNILSLLQEPDFRDFDENGVL